MCRLLAVTGVFCTCVHLKAFALVLEVGDCQAGREDDWPDVQRHFLRLLDGAPGAAAVLTASMRRAAEAVVLDASTVGCLPGHLALRMLMLLMSPGELDAEETGAMLDAEWQVMGELGWPRVVASGWPLFRMLRLLHRRVLRQIPSINGIVLHCDEDDHYGALLLQQVRHSRGNAGGNLIAEGALYLIHHSLFHEDTCPLSVAAAFLAPAWLRYPIYDGETEDLLRLAQRRVQGLTLSQIFGTQHGLLDMLDDIASSFQAFLIDSGALYVDLRPDGPDKPTVDYTRHMMSSEASSPPEGGLEP